MQARSLLAPLGVELDVALPVAVGDGHLGAAGQQLARARGAQHLVLDLKRPAAAQPSMHGVRPIMTLTITAHSVRSRHAVPVPSAQCSQPRCWLGVPCPGCRRPAYALDSAGPTARFEACLESGVRPAQVRVYSGLRAHTCKRWPPRRRRTPEAPPGPWPAWAASRTGRATCGATHKRTHARAHAQHAHADGNFKGPAAERHAAAAPGER